MKSFRQFSAFGWLVMLACGTAFAPLCLAQSEKSPLKDPGKSDPLCPTISVSCPSQKENGKGLIFAVTVNGGDRQAQLTYSWEAYGGTITKGQGTPTITLNAEDTSFTATVTIGGLDPACSSTASCSVLPGPPAPPSTKVDSYGILSRKKEKDRLAAFAITLQNNPGAQGYVLSYSGPRGGADAARKAGERAKGYLVKEGGIQSNRIVVVEGGLKEKLSIDLWVVPMGAVTPKPEPTVDPINVKPITPARKAAKHQSGFQASIRR